MPDASAEQPQQAGEVPSGTFELSVVASSDDLHLPGDQVEIETAKVEEKIRSTGDQLEFRDPIRLPDGSTSQKKFLAWKEELGDQLIRDVDAEQRLQTEDGELEGAPQRIDARYDDKSRRWYIPLQALVTGPIWNEYPGLQHLLRLDLKLSDGSLKIFHLRIRFRTIRAHLSVVSQNLPSSVAPERVTDALRAIRESGVAIRESWISNPTNRPVQAWIRSVAAPDLRVDTHAVQTRYRNHPSVAAVFFERMNDRNRIPAHAPIPDPGLQQVSSAPMRVTPAEILLADGRPAETVRAGKWTSVRIRSQERVRVRWIASVAEGVARCSLPPTTSRVFEWWNGRRSDPFKGANDLLPRAFFVTSQAYPEPWSVTGFAIQGRWTEEVSVTESWEDERALEAASVDRTPIDYRSTSGMPEPTAIPSACQGVY